MYKVYLFLEADYSYQNKKEREGQINTCSGPARCQALCQELWPAIIGELRCCFVCDRIYVRKAVLVPQQKMFLLPYIKMFLSLLFQYCLYPVTLYQTDSWV